MINLRNHRIQNTVYNSAMNFETVTEFLSNVSLLQRLPTSSLVKIAQILTFKHYERGDFVCGGEQGDGLYFIWEGEAEMCHSVNTDGENRLDFRLKKYDYFGYGVQTAISGLQANVIGLSQLTCLVIPREHSALLQAKSIWRTDQKPETCAFVEHILQLEPIKVDIFEGITLPHAPQLGTVFGGQLVGQAMAAASKTVDCLMIVRSMHSYFILAGNCNMPITYEVHRICDRESIYTRSVDAIQKGNIIFTLLASFQLISQKEEDEFEYQEVTMPTVPDPDQLVSLDELRERRIIDPRLPLSYMDNKATSTVIHWPIEIKFCEPNSSAYHSKSPHRLNLWVRAKGKLSDEQALHRCVLAYASDLKFLGATMNPHQRKHLKMSLTSLDHSIWFHRSVQADEWLLCMIENSISHNARGFCTGKMYNRKGQLVASLIQEGLIRNLERRSQSILSNL